MLCILNFPLNAQNKIQIINSDNSQMLNDADYTKLYGNCHFRHNGNDMYCDTLYLYDNKNYIEAFGNVKIIQEDAEKGTTTIKSDSLKYDGNKNIATFINNVNMLNNNTTLLTNLFVYNTKDKIGTYYNEGTILNKTDVLKSETGTYNIATKIADFSKNVSITSSSNTILTNLITYDNNLQKAYFKVPTKIIDNTDKSFIYSEEGDYNTNSTETNLYKNSYYSSEDKYFTADTMVLNEKLKTNTLTNNTLIIDKKNNTHIVSNFASSNQTTSNSLITNNVLIKSIQNNDPFYLTADTILAYDTPKDKILIPDISELTNNHSIDIKDI
ncbi:MAG: OstA-like protein [Solitalea-like symbiont of Acarus siro]